MPRCDSCNKFVSLNTDEDPEIDVVIDQDHMVSGTVRLVNSCADCGTNLTEAYLDVEIDFSQCFQDEEGKPLDGLEGEPEVEIKSYERTEREEGKGRGVKKFYGVKFTCAVKHAEYEVEDEWEDDIQASDMEDMQ